MQHRLIALINTRVGSALFRCDDAPGGSLAIDVHVEHQPERVTTDQHATRAIRQGLGRKVRHRTSQHLNNRIEQDH